MPIPVASGAEFPVPTASSHTPASAEAAEEAGLVPIVSPMVGTFYRAPSPDSPPYVDVGDEVNPGKVVCIIEAMKLFNEIESEVKGTVAKMLVESGVKRAALFGSFARGDATDDSDIDLLTHLTH